ncbi:MAG: hypothetical protein ACREN6_13345 [Gemmatimonadaceae bacterium]
MRHVMVRYKLRPECVEENTRLVETVFAALARSAPPGLTYATYKLDDGVSFMHVATVANPEGNPLQQLAEFKAFTAGVKDRCEVPPATTVLTRVGSYA